MARTMTDNQVAGIKRRMIALADSNRGCSLEEIAANAELVLGIWPDASDIGGVAMAALRGNAPITGGMGWAALRFPGGTSISVTAVWCDDAAHATALTRRLRSRGAGMAPSA
jgi:hypothetical protein